MEADNEVEIYDGHPDLPSDKFIEFRVWRHKTRIPRTVDGETRLTNAAPDFDKPVMADWSIGGEQKRGTVTINTSDIIPVSEAWAQVLQYARENGIRAIWKNDPEGLFDHVRNVVNDV